MLYSCLPLYGLGGNRTRGLTRSIWFTAFISCERSELVQLYAAPCVSTERNQLRGVRSAPELRARKSGVARIRTRITASRTPCNGQVIPQPRWEGVFLCLPLNFMVIKGKRRWRIRKPPFLERQGRSKN